jgi:hypothetical protein
VVGGCNRQPLPRTKNHEQPLTTNYQLPTTN